MKGNGRHLYRSRQFQRAALSVSVGGLMVLAALVAMTFVPVAGAVPAPLGATLKVSSGGSIQHAINLAHAGDTVSIAPGTYVEQLTIDKSITIVGAGTGKTIIQSPANLNPDAFGNPWTIEVGNSATATLSGFTLLVTQQCILLSGLPPIGFAHPHIGVYAGGGIGVGGSAVLNLGPAVVTTTGQTEGAACDGTAGEMSYGTGVDFGLDYTTASPPANGLLLGTGTISGVSISGFGFGGPGVSIGGQANSPAGSSAVISNNRITTSADDAGFDDSIANTAPAVSVGFGGNPSSAALVGNVLSGLASISTDVIDVVSGSSAYIAHNSIMVGPEQDAIVLGSSSATITFNSIQGSTTDFSGGIFLFFSSATVTFNTLSNFECEFNPATILALFGATCGPIDATEAQVDAIGDIFDAGQGTVIENNLISNADVGIGLEFGCPGCVVKGNILTNSIDYALAGYDGSYSFLQNLVVGGLYGVAAISTAVDTSVALSHVLLVGQSVAPPPYYFENDCLLESGYTCTPPTIVGT